MLMSSLNHKKQAQTAREQMQEYMQNIQNTNIYIYICILLVYIHILDSDKASVLTAAK